MYVSRVLGLIFSAIGREGIFISKTAIFLLIFISKPSARKADGISPEFRWQTENLLLKISDFFVFAVSSQK